MHQDMHSKFGMHLTKGVTLVEVHCTTGSEVVESIHICSASKLSQAGDCAFGTNWREYQAGRRVDTGSFKWRATTVNVNKQGRKT